MQHATTNQPHKADRQPMPVGRATDRPALRQRIAQERQQARDTAREVYNGLRRDMKAAGLL